MNVLSLFDGMSCGQIALKELGFNVEKYYASEIDRFAVKQSSLNFLDTIHLGSVTGVNIADLEPIGLLLGGSPCQSFSFAGKRKGMSTKCEMEILSLEHYLELKANGFEFEGQSYLFWEYMRILTDIRKYNPEVKFLLENVEMGEKWEKVLSRAIGVNGIHINSALVSAQNRKRIYWTNIGLEPAGLFGDLESTIEQPKDRKILLKDILQPVEEVDSKYYLSDKVVSNFRAYKTQTNNVIGTTEPSFRTIGQRDEVFGVYDKMGCLNATDYKQPKQIAYGCDYRKDEGFRVRKEEKSNTLMARAREDVYGTGLVSLPTLIRRLTPTECCRLQTVPDWYKWDVSDTQIYKMCGNGWNIETVKHILSYFKESQCH